MRADRGFTLIEMVVVLAIVGLLAAAAHPMLQLAAVRRQEWQLRQDLRQIRAAIDAYAEAVAAGRLQRPDGSPAEGPVWPPTLQVLVDGAPKADGQGRLRFLRRLPTDPFALGSADTAGDGESGGWGLRASDSDPAAPAPGRDVFDVYSRSERRALDGSRYRDW